MERELEENESKQASIGIWNLEFGVRMERESLSFVMLFYLILVKKRNRVWIENRDMLYHTL